MAINLKCSCGKSYSLPETKAGKKVKCPACEAVLTVPAPGPAMETEPAMDDIYRLIEEAPPLEVAAPPPLAGGQPQPSQPPASSGPSHPPYFLAGYERVFRTDKLFRAYLDGSELLFVYAGPFHSSLIATYQAEYAKGIQKGAAAGLSAGAGGAALGAGAVAVGLAIDWVAGKATQKGVAERAKVLDPMSFDDLRREVDADKHSFRVSGKNVESAVIEPPNSGFWSIDSNQDVVPAYLRFKHNPTGMWHFQLMTQGDVTLAIRGMRAALQGKPVKVVPPTR